MMNRHIVLYALDVGYIVGDKIMRWHDDPFRSRDRGSLLVYNELMHAWVTYELVQVLHIYGLAPSVRSNLKDASLVFFKIETFLRDRTNQDANDSKHAEAMIKRLFADTEHSAIFKKIIMGNMSYFKQLTTYATPFLLITWLQQLKEPYFLKHDDDFFVKGMYTCRFQVGQKILQQLTTFG
jgi:hypothetical protein